VNPKNVFEKHIASIEKLLKVADVYALLQIDHLRSTDKGIETIKEVVAKEGFSNLVHSKHFFISRDEQQLFEKNEYVSSVCQQIVQSAYAAMENYLINTFKAELLKKVVDEDISRAILDTLQFRRLDAIKKHYKNFLNIDLAQFSHRDISTYEESWFHPNSEWEGITMLSKVRNEIAHEGFSYSYEIHYPVDAYSVIHFIKRWVMFFEVVHLNERT
jgi:hypothetical protein